MGAKPGDVSFTGAQGAPMGAYLATPGSAPPWPGLIVLHEAFGLTDDIRSIADRFAAGGYLALAPDLFSWGMTARCLVTAFRSILSGTGRSFDDIRGARDHLAGMDGCNGHGGFALLCAPRGLFDVSSVNYGLVPKNAEQVLRGSCPIVGSYGGRDRGLKGKAAVLDGVLTDLGVEHDVKEYPDANHSFLNHHEGWQTKLDRVAGFGYHEEAAADAWKRIDAFFAEHLTSD
jgi:carboxymethylenebutenolidase